MYAQNRTHFVLIPGFSCPIDWSQIAFKCINFSLSGMQHLKYMTGRDNSLKREAAEHNSITIMDFSCNLFGPQFLRWTARFWQSRGLAGPQ